MSNDEITYEQVLEYCRKRNCVIVDRAFLFYMYDATHPTHFQNVGTSIQHVKSRIDREEKKNEQVN